MAYWGRGAPASIPWSCAVDQCCVVVDFDVTQSLSCVNQVKGRQLLGIDEHKHGKVRTPRQTDRRVTDVNAWHNTTVGAVRKCLPGAPRTSDDISSKDPLSCPHSRYDEARGAH